jgi:hypothetical protein
MACINSSVFKFTWMTVIIFHYMFDKSGEPERTFKFDIGKFLTNVKIRK